MNRHRVVVLALTVIAVLVGLWVAWDSTDDRDAVEEVLRGYAVTVAATQHEEAWARFTTASYRARTSEVVFRTGQHRNFEEHGPLQRLRLAADPLVPTQDEDGTAILRATVHWEGSRTSALTVFDLAREDDELRIHRTWAWPEGDPAYERVW